MEKGLLEKLLNRRIKLTIETVMPHGDKIEFAVHGQLLDVVGDTARIVNIYDKQQLFRIDAIVGVEEL